MLQHNVADFSFRIIARNEAIRESPKNLCGFDVGRGDFGAIDPRSVSESFFGFSSTSMLLSVLKKGRFLVRLPGSFAERPFFFFFFFFGIALSPPVNTPARGGTDGS